MTLHIFNPEHDIALASGLSNFTAPHAGRQLRHDLGFLPAIWAREGDVIMVDDVEQAERSWFKLAHRIKTLLGTENLPGVNCQFTRSKLPVYPEQTMNVDPWGWNSALRAVLLRRGLSESLLPTESQLDIIRQQSHRRTAARLLPKLRIEGTVGEMFECRSTDEVEALTAKYGQVVLKAPWSSSGRGIRFYSLHDTQSTIRNWMVNVIAMQGSIMVEPFYHKVKDFGMEFYSDGEGCVSYLGLSLFHTANGAYTGNVLATEKVKREIISRYVPIMLLDIIEEKICQDFGADFSGKYQGPFGVDMMVVNNVQCLLHPCVEINLRRTMGHVALALTPKDDDVRRVMRMTYSDNIYKLTINRL